jgi:rSAM/selenodomain-associated transferase 1
MRTVGIAILCKTPEAGNSKTRLSPPLLPEQCAEMSACFIRDMTANMQALCESGDVAGYAVYTPKGSETLLRQLLPPRFGLVLQCEGAFGERLRTAVEDILALGHHGAIIINSDSPTLPPAIVAEAAARLLEDDCVVLSPALDGGYTFIGLTKVRPRLFEDIPWSTDAVHRLTEERAAEIGLKICNVAPWYDVDDVASLHLLGRELAGERPSFSLPEHPAAAAPATEAYLSKVLPEAFERPKQSNATAPKLTRPKPD